MPIPLRLVLLGCLAACAAPAAPVPHAPAPRVDLLDLTRQRLALMHEVAHWKWLHNAAIEDSQRESAQLDAVTRRGVALGIDRAKVEEFFRLQIQAAKLAQKADFARWQGGAPLPVGSPRSLKSALRPEIDRIGEEILTALERGSGTPLRVGTTGDYRPFSFYNPATRAYEGIDIDMARSLARALGVELVFVPTTWPTLMADLVAGRFDLAMGGITVTEARQTLAAFSAPYLRDGKGAIARCKDKQRFRDLAAIDRPGVKVIVNPGGTNQAFVKANIRRATVQVFDDNTKIFSELVSGRADVMFTDRIEIEMQSKLHPELCATTEALTQDEKAYLLPRNSELVFLVNAWLERQQTQIELDRARKNRLR